MKLTLAAIFLSAALTAVANAQPEIATRPITIEALSGKTKSGSNAYISIHLLNQSDRRIVSAGGKSSSVDTIYDYDCRNEKGVLVRRGSLGMYDSLGDSPTIGPGESHDEWVPINMACDLSLPGDYTVQISRVLPDSSGNEERVQSNIISLTILPRDGQDVTNR